MTYGYTDTGFPSRDQWNIGVGTRRVRSWMGDDRTAADKAANRYPPHPYSCVYVTHTAPLTSFRFKDDPDWYSQSSQWCGYPAFKDDWDANSHNNLLNKLFAIVKGGEFNAAVATAQLDKSVAMIGSSAIKIGRAWRAAMHGNFSAAASALVGPGRSRRHKLASNWLELQYGWLPLLEDTKKAAELIADRVVNPRLPVYRVRSRKVTEANEPSHGFWQHDFVRTIHREQIVCELREQLSFTQVIGLSDPFSVAWELVPYSFVLDWFLPIGPWLEAASAARTLEGTFITTSYVTQEARGLQSGNFYQVVGGDSWGVETVSVERSITTSLTPKIPAFKPFEKVASLGHTLNALALLQNLKR